MKNKSIFQLGMFFIAMFMAQPLLANESPMRGNAKFNVVAAVLLIIFLGIVVFLIYLDRKITKLEKEKDQKQ